MLFCYESTLRCKAQRFLVKHTSDLVTWFTFFSVTSLTDEEPFREHAVGGGVSDEEDEGEPTRTQERQPSHHGGIPVCAGEAYVPTVPAWLTH